MKPIWLIHDTPLSDGADRELSRWLREAGVDESVCHHYHYRNEATFIGDLSVDKPPFIIPLSSPASGSPALGQLCPFTVEKRTNTAAITKYRGSLLCSKDVAWQHYVVPAFTPGYVFSVWDERQAAVLCLAKLAEEYEYWRAWGILQPPPQRKLIADPGADDCIDYLNGVLSSPPETIVSIDIENIGVYRGKYKTKQRNRVPYVIGFATDPLTGISIGLGEYERDKLAAIWRLIDRVFRKKKQVGQNYYTHDLPWMHYLGFIPSLEHVHDTLVRHHVLWPELSHKLDYQTFQYTREPYYKDEGKNWTVKERQTMKRYNVKDVCVTLEIYLAQEAEFAARA
jgi:hypothetical protein